MVRQNQKLDFFKFLIFYNTVADIHEVKHNLYTALFKLFYKFEKCDIHFYLVIFNSVHLIASLLC